MKLSEHFTLDEMVVSQEAARKGIPNIPTDADIAALKELCTNVLEPLRQALGKPVVVSSGYRSQTVNSLVGGSKTSDHLYGRAADISCPGMAPINLAKLIVSMHLPFDQLIVEFGSWVHVSIPSPKREVLTAMKNGGQTVYMKGL